MESYIFEKEKLEGEYRQTFERVETYSFVKSIDNDIAEDMLMNLLDMLYTAQVEGKPVKKIVGDDIERFCEDYFEDKEDKLGDKIKRIPKLLYSCCWIMMVLCILDIVFPEEKIKITDAYVDVGGVIFGSITGLVGSLLILYILRLILFKVKKINAAVVEGIFLAVFAVLFVILIALYGDREVRISLIKAMTISGIYIVIYKSIQLYMRNKTTGTIKKVKKKSLYKEIWHEGLKEGMRTLPIEFKNKWEKKNKRLRNRGKAEITPEEFTDKIRKDNKTYVVFLPVTYSIIYIIFLIGVAYSSTIIDTIIFGIILAIVYGILLKIFLFGNIRKMREDMIRKCDEEGITIIDLANRIEQEKTCLEENYKKTNNKN